MMMSVITHRKAEKIFASAGQTDRAFVASHLPAVVSFLGEGIRRGARFFMHVAEAFAEARMQRAVIEAELYLHRYKHSSKNDDDLPNPLYSALTNSRSFPNRKTTRRSTHLALSD
jgi:hypothetical protein